MNRLIDILSYRRAHESEGERQMIAKYLTPYEPTTFLDEEGDVVAYVIDVAHKVDGVNLLPPVLWSCHTDTVHSDLPTDAVRQRVVVDTDKDFNMAFKTDNDPLGADCGAGIWLMLEMIDANVPGTYVFHRAEECGGLGSSGMLKTYPEWLGNFKYAIAFDRRGTSDVITMQYSGTCCSSAFALALAAKLNHHAPEDAGFAYKPDDTGVFTDTANYRSIIPECTNISVGYLQEHTKHETLDLAHLTALRAALIDAFKDGIDLPVVRTPTDENDKWAGWDDSDWVYKRYAGGGYGYYRKQGGTVTGYVGKPSVEELPVPDLPFDADEVLDMKYAELQEAVECADPEDITALIWDLATQVYSARVREEELEKAAANDDPLELNFNY